MHRLTFSGYFTFPAWVVLSLGWTAGSGTGAAPEPPKGGQAAILELPLEKGEEVQKLCLSPDNRSLVAAVANKEGGVGLYRWDLRTRERKFLTWLGWSRQVEVRGITWYPTSQ